MNLFDGDAHQVDVAWHAYKNSLLHLDGWKKYKKFTKRLKKLWRQIHQAQLSSARTSARYKCGVRVPRNHKEAMYFDYTNGNTKWKDAEKRERDEVNSFNTKTQQNTELLPVV